MSSLLWEGPDDGALLDVAMFSELVQDSVSGETRFVVPRTVAEQMERVYGPDWRDHTGCRGIRGGD